MKPLKNGMLIFWFVLILLASGCISGLGEPNDDTPCRCPVDDECRVNCVKEIGIKCNQSCLIEMRKPVGEFTFTVPLDVRKDTINRMVTADYCATIFQNMTSYTSQFYTGEEVSEFCIIEYVSLEDEVGCKCWYSKSHLTINR